MQRILSYIFILSLPLLLAGCSHNPQQSASEQEADPNMVEITTVQMKQLKLDTARMQEERTDLILPGRVSFNRDFLSQIYPFVGGNVLKIAVSLGDYVKKGQVLAVIRGGDMSNYESQYDQDKAQVRLAKRNLDIAEELYKTKVYAEKDVLQAQIAYKAALDLLTKDEVYLKSYGVHDSNMKGEYNIVSPIDGYIITKSINEGTNIRPDNTNALFTVSSLETVWVLANIYENDVPNIHEGDSADITTVAYPDAPRKGYISKIATVMDSTAGTLQARIVLTNSNGLLKAGMFATIKIHLDKHRKAIAIPKESLVFYDNNYYVMVAKGGGKFIRTQVSVEGDNDKAAYISTGIKAGDVVVSKGSLYVYGQ